MNKNLLYYDLCDRINKKENQKYVLLLGICIALKRKNSDGLEIIPNGVE